MASISSILQEVDNWSEDERLELLVGLAKLVKERHNNLTLTTNQNQNPSVFDLAEEYAGIMEGPSDLSSNKKYLDDLGS